MHSEKYCGRCSHEAWAWCFCASWLKWFKTFPLSVWEVIMQWWNVCVAMFTHVICCDCKTSKSAGVMSVVSISISHIHIWSLAVFRSPFSLSLALHLLYSQCLHHWAEGGSQGTHCSNCFTSVQICLSYLTPSTEGVKLFSKGVKLMAVHSVCTCLDVKSFIMYRTWAAVHREWLLKIFILHWIKRYLLEKIGGESALKSAALWSFLASLRSFVFCFTVLSVILTDPTNLWMQHFPAKSLITGLYTTFFIPNLTPTILAST